MADHDNEDAILAALCWAKQNQDNGTLTAEHVAIQRTPTEREAQALPPFDLTPEQIEAIYPGAAASVRRGLVLATQLLASPDIAERMARSNDPFGRAVKRFLASDLLR